MCCFNITEFSFYIFLDKKKLVTHKFNTKKVLPNNDNIALSFFKLNYSFLFITSKTSKFVYIY